MRVRSPGVVVAVSSYCFNFPPPHCQIMHACGVGTFPHAKTLPVHLLIFMATVFSKHKIFTSESDSECESVPTRQLSLPPSSQGEVKQWQSAPAVVKMHYFYCQWLGRRSMGPRACKLHQCQCTDLNSLTLTATALNQSTLLSAIGAGSARAVHFIESRLHLRGTIELSSPAKTDTPGPVFTSSFHSRSSELGHS